MVTDYKGKPAAKIFASFVQRKYYLIVVAAAGFALVNTAPGFALVNAVAAWQRNKVYQLRVRVNVNRVMKCLQLGPSQDTNMMFSVSVASERKAMSNRSSTISLY